MYVAALTCQETDEILNGKIQKHASADYVSSFMKSV